MARSQTTPAALLNKQGWILKFVSERTHWIQLGNTTAATGKGFAIGSAALTSLALLATYAATIGPKVDSDGNAFTSLTEKILANVFNLLDYKVLNRPADRRVDAVRLLRALDGRGRDAQPSRWCRKSADSSARCPASWTVRKTPDYERAISISTDGALREMIIPGLIAVIVPIFVGAVISAEALGGLLIGSIAAGAMLALMMANAGGAWDNAKKYIEEGNFGGKGSDAHSAAVVGDTVRRPVQRTPPAPRSTSCSS